MSCQDSYTYAAASGGELELTSLPRHRTCPSLGVIREHPKTPYPTKHPSTTHHSQVTSTFNVLFGVDVPGIVLGPWGMSQWLSTTEGKRRQILDAPQLRNAAEDHMGCSGGRVLERHQAQHQKMWHSQMTGSPWAHS